MTIRIDYWEPNFILTFPYNKKDLNAVRNLPVREFKKKLLHWEVPQLVVKTLDILQDTDWSPEALNAREYVEKSLLDLVDYKFKSGDHEEGKLRPYQRVGVDFLKRAKKALLNDDMGLGKTIQSIASIVETEDVKDVLILCPATLKWNWFRQFNEHFDIDPIVIQGSSKQREELWNGEGKYFIANYELLARDWNIMPHTWGGIIADEAVYLKNPKSQRTKFARRLKSQVRIALTGTSWELNLAEFHAIMTWVRPEILPNVYRFIQRYCELDYFGSIIGYKNLDELHQLTSPFILRRTKEEVLTDLPPKIFTDVPLEYSDGWYRSYKILAGEFLEWLESRTDKELKAQTLNPLTQTIRLRQFVEFPELVSEDLDFSNGRLEYIKELYREAGKLAVFTFFNESAKKIKDFFDTEFYISGDVDPKKRIGIINKFNEAESGLYISTDAGRFGVDLIGVDKVVHYGYLYNPASMTQREDRLHRFGQKKTVNVYRPFYPGTIDEGIMSIASGRWGDIIEFMEGTETMSRAKLSKVDYRRLVYGEL